MSQLVIPEINVEPPPEGGDTYRCLDCDKEHTRITRLIDATCPKFALVPWAEGVGRRAMWSIMRETPSLTIDAATKLIKERDLTSNAERDAGATRGTATHSFLGRYIDTGEVESIVDYPDTVKPFLKSLSQFLLDYEPEFLCREVYLAHHRLDYAGTMDGICIIHNQPPRRNKPIDLTGKRVLFDLKTNREGRVYPPGMLYQTAGYELAWRELGGEPNDEQIVVAVGKDSYQVKVSHYEPEAFEPLVAFYHSQKEQDARNPNGRKA
jgi:hypothetical protein